MYASDFFQGEYHRMADLNGLDLRSTVADVGSVTFRGENKPKPVIFLEGDEKGWPLNKTQVGALAKVLGNDMLTWRGATIEFHPITVDFPRENTASAEIRVLARPGEAAPSAYRPIGSAVTSGIGAGSSQLRPAGGGSVPRSDLDDSIPFQRA